MCGRYVLKSNLDQIKKNYGAAPETGFDFLPVYNAAPSFDMPVMLGKNNGDLQRIIRQHRWGLIPHWAKEKNTGYSMINARAETLAKKPAFRGAFKKRRCVVPADGFFEWKGQAGDKQPYYITRSGGELMPFAGLYESWTSPDGDVVDSFTIVTTEANQTIEPLHDRMPVILAGADELRIWLNPEKESPNMLSDLLRPYPEDDITIRPVSKKVNNPQNQGSDLIKPIHDLFG